MIFHRLFGYCRISFANEYKKAVFEILSLLDTPFWDINYDDTLFSISVPLASLRRFLFQCKGRGVEICSKKYFGFPQLLLRYRKRVGLLLGTVAGLLIIWASGRVIWCVDVKGNTKVSDEEIIAGLASLGCGVGDVHDKIDFEVLHNEFLMENRDIAWISVNMNGNHANVEVREVMDGGEKTKEGFYNIVAAEGGQIEMIAATEGKSVVERFDTVLEGELLITGVISYKEGTKVRFESASGSVFAVVSRGFQVSVPVKNEIKVETGEKTTQNTLRFFKLKINLFRNSRISYKLCDKIAVNNQIYLFDAVPLPLYVDRTVFSEYKMEKHILTKDEARDKAMALYREKLKDTLGEAQLLSKSFTESFDGESYNISCNIYCLADIAKKVPLEINENTEETGK